MFVLWLEVNFVGVYFSVELFSWTHGAREAKSTFSYVATQEMYNLLEYPPKFGFLLLSLGYHVSWTYGRGTGNRAKPSSVANCWTVQGSLLYAWKYNKPCTRRPCMCQETCTYAIRQSLPTWRNHSCNMKLLPYW